LNAWTNLYETWYAHRGTRAHLNDVLHNSSPQSVCLYVYPPPLFGSCSVRNHRGTKCTPNNRRMFGRVVLYLVRVLSKESLWVCLCIPLSLQGNGSVNMFSQQRRIVGGVVFCAFLVLSNGSRRLVLPRTSGIFSSSSPSY
jgi:hypothetical protein